MAEISVNVPASAVLVPENDTQELWQLEGRIEALRGYLANRRTSTLSTVYIDDVLAIIGSK